MRRLKDVARVVSCAYMHCYMTLGPEGHALSAALKGDEEMEAFLREQLDSYVVILPHRRLDPEEVAPRRISLRPVDHADSDFA